MKKFAFVSCEFYVFYLCIAGQRSSDSKLLPTSEKHDMSSEIEGEMQGLILEEGSSQADWENLFKKCPDARDQECPEVTATKPLVKLYCYEA